MVLRKGFSFDNAVKVAEFHVFLSTPRPAAEAKNYRHVGGCFSFLRIPKSIASLGVFGERLAWERAICGAAAYPSGMTDDAGDDRRFALELREAFPRGEVGRALADVALAAWRSGDRDLPAFRDRLSDAGCYATRELADNAATRSGDLSTWFALPELPFEELARRGRALRAAWAAAADPEEEERLEIEQWKADAEAERIARIEDAGGFGRTHHYDPECERHIYIRLGDVPAGGYSRFGLAGADIEDGPDPWRAATGNKVREPGMSVFRAYRHPDVPDAYVLVEPDFRKAIYDVSSSEDHLLAVMPRGRFTILRIDGSPVVATRRGVERIVLGTDGEYLIDPARPWTVSELPDSAIWISEEVRLTDFVARHDPDRGAPADDVEAAAASAPRP